MKRQTTEQMKRVAMPMVRREEDTGAILEAVKDTLNMQASEENRDLIMDVIRECKADIAEEIWNAMPPRA